MLVFERMHQPDASYPSNIERTPPMTCTCPGGPLADDGFHAVGCPARRPAPLFTEEERIDGLLEIITDEASPTLFTRAQLPRIVDICTYEDEGGLWALTPLAAVVHTDAQSTPHEDCTVVWRADVDGLHARCTLLSSDGSVLATWEAHGNA
jgi:hypothetical protein